MASEATKATRRPRADAMRNREALLLAAAEVFCAGGPEASLDAVARRAGVGIATLYRHFPTREALFEAVYRREVEQLAALAGELAGREAPVPALRLWLRGLVGVVATKRGMIAALAIAADGASDLHAFSLAQLTRAVGGLLARAAAAGEIRGDVGPEDILQMLVGLCLMGRQPGWEESVVRLADVFVDGLRLAPQPAPVPEG